MLFVIFFDVFIVLLNVLVMAGLDLSTTHYVHQLHHPADFNLQRQPDDEVDNQFSDDHHHEDNGHQNQG